MSLYLEDVVVGTQYFSDEETPTFFGGLVASGWHTAAITMRQLFTVRTLLFARPQ